MFNALDITLCRIVPDPQHLTNLVNRYPLLVEVHHALLDELWNWGPGYAHLGLGLEPSPL